MSSFELTDLGDGRFELGGEMSFQNANEILEAGESAFGQHQSLRVDLSNVTKADSAGLALLLEWKAQAAKRSGEIRYLAVPDGLLAIAKTTEVSDLI